MITTKTDREKSLQATEYLWDMASDTEVHTYVKPVLQKWLAPRSDLRLLDLGCGNGALTSYFSSMGLNCWGTDFSHSGIEIAKRNFPGTSFFQSNIQDPLSAEHLGVYDIVVAVEVVEHLLLPRQLLARAKEALKPGGTLIITTPYHGYLKNLALAFAGKFDSHWHPLRDYGHVKFFSVATLSQLIEEQGFSVKSVARVGRIPVFARSMMLRAELPL